MENENSINSAHQLLDLFGLPSEIDEGKLTIAGRIEILRQALAFETGLKQDNVKTAVNRLLVSGEFKRLASWNATFTLPGDAE